jgi:beta-ribofuranosylaminobenzene 5'-phosphate synthase
MNAVRISTPSRLHFGLLRLHESPGRSYGGLGMMIDRPRVVVEMAAAEAWGVRGPSADRAREFADRSLASVCGSQRPRALRIKVLAEIPGHAGLGSGTQLALAIAAGVRTLAGLDLGSAAELAALANRGARSAVGSHGFVHGGLIWELGRTRDQQLSELSSRVAIPESWRIVLVAIEAQTGLSGALERQAFEAVPPVPPAVTGKLEAIAAERILPAARNADFDAFSEGVFDYGRQAGECFAAVQGGPFAFQETADCVLALRQLGVRGVGQSSWGPTVFALAPNEASAHALVANLKSLPGWSRFKLSISAPDNRGAIIESAVQPSRDAERHSNP